MNRAGLPAGSRKKTPARAEARPLRAESSHDDHPLKGPWEDYRGCHVQGDWCLIYQNSAKELVLVRTGTHSDLFGE
ncbi:type II toxin-antitoxin system YafQ family toxin [Bradyrhizobium sp. USDA 4502]